MYIIPLLLCTHHIPVPFPLSLFRPVYINRLFIHISVPYPLLSVFVHFVSFVSFVSCMHTCCACMCVVTSFYVMCVWMLVYMCMCTACPCSIHACVRLCVWCVNVCLVLSGNTSRPPRGARWYSLLANRLASNGTLHIHRLYIY